MKAPTSSVFAVLLAAVLAAGCTVNVHTRPNSEPSPDQSEPTSDAGKVEPTDRRERVQPIPDPRRRTDEEVSVRREERPKQDPEPEKTKNEAKTPEEDETKVPEKNKDETKPTDDNRREKERDTEAKKPEAKSDPDNPPDRPGEGKGRRESQETYPGKGKATGLEKQQDKDGERTNQGNSNGRDKQPEAKQDSVATRQPTAEKKPDAKPENDSAQDRGKQPEPKKDPPVTKQQEPKQDPAVAKQPEPKKDPAAAKQGNSDKKPGERPDATNAPKEQKKAQSVAPEPKDNREPETDNRDAGPPAKLGIQSKHLPGPGECRVWVSGRPAGDQAKSRDCGGIESTAPAGSWVLYRPEKDKKVVHVKEMDHGSRGTVAHVWVYDASSGKYLREEVSR
jgi:hypothetical protein